MNVLQDDQIASSGGISAVKSLTAQLAASDLTHHYGYVTHIGGPIVKAAFGSAEIGDVCALTGAGGAPMHAEVIALDGAQATLSLFGPAAGLRVGSIVRPVGKSVIFGFGVSLLGQVLDGYGRVIQHDQRPFQGRLQARPARAAAPPPLSRPLVDTPLVTGLRVVDSMTTLGRGQRIGIFGPPGTGKTTLLTAIASGCDADVIVIGLIGERGREVQEFLSRHLPPEKRNKMVVVVATSDRPAMERIYAAHVATAVAEGFRDLGKSVLLMVDSLTRVARALREVGLAAGEAPTRRGYPASVYPALPELIERAGRGARGDITAIYTVLLEGDGRNDPIAEETKSLTDGHITLSPDIAAAGQYPAIDVAQSLSRIMPNVVDAETMRLSHRARSLIAKHAEIEILVQIGEYTPGSDPLADEAVQRMPALRAFFAQGGDVISPIGDTLGQLKAILA